MQVVLFHHYMDVRAGPLKHSLTIERSTSLEQEESLVSITFNII
jgi:hypothetical protein